MRIPLAKSCAGRHESNPAEDYAGLRLRGAEAAIQDGKPANQDGDGWPAAPQCGEARQQIHAIILKRGLRAA